MMWLALGLALGVVVFVIFLFLWGMFKNDNLEHAQKMIDPDTKKHWWDYL